MIVDLHYWSHSEVKSTTQFRHSRYLPYFGVAEHLSDWMVNFYSVSYHRPILKDLWHSNRRSKLIVMLNFTNTKI